MEAVEKWMRILRGGAHDSGGMPDVGESSGDKPEKETETLAGTL